ncbi:hypothetical protein [Microseira wollei]|uniref:Uncharacterized protein n=1 Tax=Microseira wollei NIES-4236 TaxID=2530354 RepID=A0AAV3XA00_9CYAN|nr:hypothetical protein [Microseira wollei]GET37117.1 hypothetical protein MiSe_18700 [Microseira wollei NIES-4236]
MASKTLCVQGCKIRGGNCPAESTTQKYTDSSNPKAVVVTVKPSDKDGVSTHFSDEGDSGSGSNFLADLRQETRFLDEETGFLTGISGCQTDDFSKKPGFLA